MGSMGRLAGAGLGVAILFMLSVLLLRTPGADHAVLVAVWLWSLPVLGATTAFGWATERVLHAISTRSGR